MSTKAQMKTLALAPTEELSTPEGRWAVVARAQKGDESALPALRTLLAEAESILDAGPPWPRSVPARSR